MKKMSNVNIVFTGYLGLCGSAILEHLKSTSQKKSIISEAGHL